MRPELPAYAELRCVSAFSFLHGASRPEELVDYELAGNQWVFGGA